MVERRGVQRAGPFVRFFFRRGGSRPRPQVGHLGLQFGGAAAGPLGLGPPVVAAPGEVGRPILLALQRVLGVPALGLPLVAALAEEPDQGTGAGSSTPCVRVPGCRSGLRRWLPCVGPVVTSVRMILTLRGRNGRHNIRSSEIPMSRPTFHQPRARLLPSGFHLGPRPALFDDLKHIKTRSGTRRTAGERGSRWQFIPNQRVGSR